MKVKIKDTVYDSECEPIMVVLSWQDKANITDMAKDAYRYVSAPATFDTGDMFEFMKLPEDNKESKRKYEYRDNEYDRRTGRSTARYLLAMGYACLSPGATVEFKDHIPNITHEYTRRHYEIINRFVSKLGLPIEVTMVKNRIFLTVAEKE